MAQGRITKRTVDAAHPSAANIFLWDEKLKGFGLKVTPTGAKSYIYQYRLGGRASKTQRYTIGGHGSPWSPDTARTEAERLAVMVGQGIDIVEDRRERERRRIDLAFAAYVETFATDYLAANWKDDRDGASTLRRLAVPVLRNKPVNSLTRSDLVAVLEAVPPKQVATRRKLFALLRKLVRWAMGRGDIPQTANPLVGFDPPPLPQSRERVLDDDELALAWRGAGELGKPFGPWVRLLFALGQRREETAAMEWRELGRAERQWVIPGPKAKNGETHVVHLNDLAIAELDGMAGGEKWPRRGLVFSTTGESSISGFSKAKKRLDGVMVRQEAKRAADVGDDPMEVDPWRYHDARRTVATGMQRLGVRFEVVEACLNHKSGSQAKGSIAKVYQRHDWKEEKRAAIDAWSAHIESVLTGSDETNVVPIASARA